MARFQIERLGQIEPVPCHCGASRRAFLDDPAQTATLHRLTVGEATQTHYHKKATEIYYVLAGTGQIELDGQSFDIGEGDSVLIHPGCRHRAVGKLELLVIPIPAHDPSDEFFDE
ncbi:MAG: cupin domain-containing protein [Planctomycetales bacterium]|nr:cupin domain-containing protein [Planctomycetales bacterium]